MKLYLVRINQPGIGEDIFDYEFVADNLEKPVSLIELNKNPILHKYNYKLSDSNYGMVLRYGGSIIERSVIKTMQIWLVDIDYKIYLDNSLSSVIRNIIVKIRRDLKIDGIL